MDTSLEPLSPEEVELNRRQLEAASRRVSLIALTDDNPPTPGGIYDNGTVSFLEIDGRKVVVTNRHVWQQFVLDHEDNSDVRAIVMGHGLTNAGFDFSDAELITQSPDPNCGDQDIAILEFPSDLVEESGKEYTEIKPEYLARATGGTQMSFFGFPGMRRQSFEVASDSSYATAGGLYFEIINLAPTVEGVSDLAVRMRFTNETLFAAQHSPIPMSEFRWGGMSGSLVYRLDPDSNRFIPSGILKQAGDDLNGTFYATHLDHVVEMLRQSS